jgi:hypothetical protein
VEDAIKWKARKHKLQGETPTGDLITVKEGDEFDVIPADYFDVLAGAIRH